MLHRGAAAVYVNLSETDWAVEVGDDQEIWLATTTAHDGAPVEEGPVTLSPDSVAVIGPRLTPPMSLGYAEYV